MRILNLSCLMLTALAMAGCGKSATTTMPVAAPPTTPDSNVAAASLNYWNGLNSLPSQIAPDMSRGAQEQIKALRGAANIIRLNPVIGVDPDLTDWASRMASSLQQRADLIEQSRSPALLAEAFLRGMQGDPFGTGIELNQAERSWLANHRALTREQQQLRARLTSRYGTEFPPP